MAFAGGAAFQAGRSEQAGFAIDNWNADLEVTPTTRRGVNAALAVDGDVILLQSD